MQKYYPNSKITAKAIARLGKAYGDIAFYEGSASDKLEEYAKKYAGEKDAYDAMSDAVFYPQGPRRRRRRRSTTPSTSSRSVRSEATSGDAANAELLADVGLREAGRWRRGDQAPPRVHPRVYGEKGGADRLVQAYEKIGATLWHQACPVKEVDGECVKITRERALSTKKADQEEEGAKSCPRSAAPSRRSRSPSSRAMTARSKEAMAAYRRGR